MVWLTVCYFTASKQGGCGGSWAITLHSVTQLTLLDSGGRERGGAGGVAFPPLDLFQTKFGFSFPLCVGAGNVARNADGAATEASPLHRQVQGDPREGKGATRLYVKSRDSVRYKPVHKVLEHFETC